jgi:hypothetical protein
MRLLRTATILFAVCRAAMAAESAAAAADNPASSLTRDATVIDGATVTLKEGALEVVLATNFTNEG